MKFALNIKSIFVQIMITIHSFTFNPFQENTYIVSDETSDCIIIDPGCYTKNEKQILVDFISDKKYRPVKILLTHSHIDHILGNNFLAGKYGIPIEMSEIEIPLLMAASEYGKMWGIDAEPSPEPTLFITEGKNIVFGNTLLKAIFTPGHSQGSFSFLHAESNSLFSGDVLFMQSIGRTDLPGGNYDVLMKSIKEKLLILDDEIKVYPGHGPSTTIGNERRTNPFLQ
jgi:hydroxyacylglutathione hydrolase